MTDQRTPTGDYEAYEARAITDDAPTSTRTAADLAMQIDALRIAAGKVDALAAVAVESYDHADWGSADPVQVERLAYLLGATAEAAAAVVTAVDRFRAFVADRQRAEGADDWGDR